MAQSVQETSQFFVTIQDLLQEYPHDTLLQELEKFCRQLHTQAVAQEQDMLRQRAKMSWHKDGNQCTRVFFKKVAVKRVKQKIHQLQAEGGSMLVTTQEVA